MNSVTMWQTIGLLISCSVVVSGKYNYETKLFTVPVDHFSYQNNGTFQIRYLENNDFSNNGNGPIFFYTGNEGQIEVFANYTGFMWDIASEYGARLVFAEHRYYGKSLPFGDKSLDNEHIGYLTSSQALADYADLIDFLQGNALSPQHPVIAFGGSYGGMLAAYFRMKYPHMVAGAIAASAPIHMFPGMMHCEVFNRIVTSSFTLANAMCSENIRKSWAVIRNFTATNATAPVWLKKNWRLCHDVKNSTETDLLVDFLTSMYTTLAMVNYPFSSEFLLPLPAYPVRVVCQYLNEILNGMELLKGIGKVLETYTNYDHNNKCVDYRKGDNYVNLDAGGWDYQACTEMVMPICSTGKGDMFELNPWNYTEYAQECHKKYNVYPRPNDARVMYGGALLHAASNIVFSNGLLDPWMAGGLLDSTSDSIKAELIVGAAHHLDLMANNPADPGSVRRARNTHKQHITKWIHEYYERKKSERHSNHY